MKIYTFCNVVAYIVFMGDIALFSDLVVYVVFMCVISPQNRAEIAMKLPDLEIG